jgi:pimeloyl-ACP methyl ester carboxylesterase
MSQRMAYTPMGPMEYRLEGSGPTVMVLNGGHCSRDTLLSHERLADTGFSVLTPSRPGYDDTPSETGRTAQEAADALAALLDVLQIQRAYVIGISAAGHTALSFAQRHPSRTQKLILESAMTMDWSEFQKKRSRIGFGRAERVTWAVMHTMLKLFPKLMIKALMRDLTTLDVDEVLRWMSADDMAFILRMLQTSRSGTGFMNDIEHHVENLAVITSPVLVMFSPNDNTVSPMNAQRVYREVKNCELYETPSDSHLIWIGKSANDVWNKRLSFLQS